MSANTTGSPSDDQESIRKCPYCGNEHKSRGLFSHVRQTDEKGHGPRKEVPDSFSVEDAEIVGYTETNRKKPVSNSKSGKELILCKICGNTSKGMHGFHIHAKLMAGKENHPEDPADIDESQFRAIPTDEHWKPTGQFDEVDEEYRDMVQWENDNHDNESEKTMEGMFIPVDELRELQDLLIRSREKQPVVDEIERIVQRYS